MFTVEKKYKWYERRKREGKREGGLVRENKGGVIQVQTNKHSMQRLNVIG